MSALIGISTRQRRRIAYDEEQYYWRTVPGHKLKTGFRLYRYFRERFWLVVAFLYILGEDSIAKLREMLEDMLIKYEQSKYRPFIERWFYVY